MVGGVHSEAIGGVGAETESKNGSRFREFLDRSVQSLHLLEMAEKRGM